MRSRDDDDHHHHRHRPADARSRPSHGTLRPLGLDEVQITGGFWAQRQAVNGDASLAHIEHWMEREGWIGNFDRGRGRHPARRAAAGREFSDSEVYKLLEAMAWEIGRTDDAALDGRFRALVARVAAAQEPDGYLNTMFGRPGQRPRYSDLEWGHELYCYGHLFQAAVARARTRPDADDGLLAVARRAADHVVEAFGPDGIASRVRAPRDRARAGRAGPGRPVSGATSTRRALFVERRGTGTLADIELGRAYYQDDVPVRDATVLRGHAVRANYLAAGAVDVAVETDDDDLLDALDHAVGEHGRPPHLRHRRAGLAARGRGVRRRLRPAAGPRVLRDLRRRRLGDVLLAAAAGPGAARGTPT